MKGGPRGGLHITEKSQPDGLVRAAQRGKTEGMSDFFPTSSDASSAPSSWLRGQMLIATPAIGDSRFARSVVFLCNHSPEASMGIVVNKPHSELSVKTLMDQMDISATRLMGNHPVLLGGPVDMDRGFVLHTDDYSAGDATMSVADGVSMTATKEALNAMADDGPPSRAALALGYAGWGPGQLEQEVQENSWLICAPQNEIIFGTQHDDKWAAALSSIGVSAAHLSAITGQA